MHCLNCDTEFSGKFCPECGQSAKVRKLNMKDVFATVPNAVLSIEGRYWLTIRDFLRDPRKMVKEYAGGKRKKYASPVQFFFVFASISMLLQFLIYGGVTEAVDIAIQSATDGDDFSDKFSRATAIIAKAQSAYKNYFELGIPIFLGFVMALIYRKTMNLAEALSFSFYAMAIGIELSSIFLLFIPDQGIREALQTIVSLLILAYLFYFIATKYRWFHILLGPISLFLATILYGAVFLLIVLGWVIIS